MYIDNYGRFCNDELMHYGIMGMHWGVRRYQPYPGSYRGEGKFVGKNKNDSTGVVDLQSTVDAMLNKYKTSVVPEDVLNRFHTGVVNQLTKEEKDEGIELYVKSKQYDKKATIYEEKYYKLFREHRENDPEFKKLGKKLTEYSNKSTSYVDKEAQLCTQKANKLLGSKRSSTIRINYAPLRGYKRSLSLNEVAKGAMMRHIDSYESRVKALKRSGKTYAEIADALGISESSVSSLLSI